MKVEHAGCVKTKGEWGIYADAKDALAWTPALAEAAHQVLTKLIIGNKNTRAIFELDGKTVLAMRTAKTGDVWRRGNEIAVVDFTWKPRKKNLDAMAERVFEVPGQPKPAGSLKIHSGCLAVFAPAKKIGFTAADVENRTFAGPTALLIPMPNGTYEARWDLLAKKSNWAPIYHVDDLATYGSRMLLTKKR